MKKLERAAQEYGELGTPYASADFKAGARWALEQMTSEAAVKQAACLIHVGFPTRHDSARELMAVVRKEIEG